MRFKPKGARELQHYAFIVITETQQDTRPPGSKAEYLDYFHTGQIIVCDVTGGTPIEVATHVKPGKLDCRWEQFEVLDQAIEYAYMITESGWDQKREDWTEKGRPRRRPHKKPQKERRRKSRHQA